MLAIVVVLTLTPFLLVIWPIGLQLERRRDTRTAAQMERLRIQHEQYVAERRLQTAVQDGLQQMLQTARDSDSGERSWRQQ